MGRARSRSTFTMASSREWLCKSARRHRIVPGSASFRYVLEPEFGGHGRHSSADDPVHAVNPTTARRRLRTVPIRKGCFVGQRLRAGVRNTAHTTVRRPHARVPRELPDRRLPGHRQHGGSSCWFWRNAGISFSEWAFCAVGQQQHRSGFGDVRRAIWNSEAALARRMGECVSKCPD